MAPPAARPGLRSPGCRRSSVVEQRFRKPLVGSSNLPVGSRGIWGQETSPDPSRAPIQSVGRAIRSRWQRRGDAREPCPSRRATWLLDTGRDRHGRPARPADDAVHDEAGRVLNCRAGDVGAASVGGTDQTWRRSTGHRADPSAIAFQPLRHRGWRDHEGPCLNALWAVRSDTDSGGPGEVRRRPS